MKVFNKNTNSSKLNWALDAYARATESLIRLNSLGSLMQDICESIAQENAYPLAWIAKKIDNTDKDIELIAASGSARDFLDDVDVSWDDEEKNGLGPTGVSIRTGKIQVIENISEDLAYSHWKKNALKYNLHSCISVPIQIEDAIYGTLNVYSSKIDAFDNEILSVFKGLAEHIAIGISRIQIQDILIDERIEKQDALKKFSNGLESIIYAITKAMEERDPYTAGHESRVSHLSVAIAKEMNLESKYIAGLKMAALVHDIGKIAVPLEILVKPSRLTYLEFEMIKMHSEKGYKILKDIPFEFPIAEIVYQHHEKLDGSGYPLGLKENEILLESKILTVADIVESMASHRPYRAALGIEKALEEIQKLSGKQLDSSVVNACVNLFRLKNYELPIQ